MRNKEKVTYAMIHILYGFFTMVSAVIVGLNAPTPLLSMLIQFFISALITILYVLYFFKYLPQKEKREE